MQLSSKANLYLTLATLMWGVAFPLVRNALTEVDPFTFVSLRFSVAALLSLLPAWVLLRGTTWPMLGGSLLVAVFSASGYLFQTIGLETVASARAAFITNSSIIFVPFLVPLFKLGKLSLLDVFCALLGLTGLYVLTDVRHVDISTGDLWIFMSAIAFSLQIIYLHRLTASVENYRLIAFYQVLFSAVFLSLLMGSGHDFTSALQLRAMLGILFCAVFATSLAYHWQTKYQKFSGASKAALIFALEPVFASLSGFVINHEVLSLETIYGGGLLLMSLVLPSIVNMLRASIAPVK